MTFKHVATALSLLLLAACQSSGGGSAGKSAGGDPGGTKMSVAEIQQTVTGQKTTYMNQNLSNVFAEFRAGGQGVFYPESQKWDAKFDWDVTEADGLCMRNLTPALGGGVRTLCFKDLRRKSADVMVGLAGGQMNDYRELKLVK